MKITELSTEALLGRKAIAALLETSSWAFEAHGDTGDYGVGILLDDNGVVVSGEQQTGKNFIAEVIAVEVKKAGYAAHIAANDPPTVIATIDELLRLREENERLEKELESARNWATSQHEVAKMAWGGEIPSPLPGHTHMTEEEACAMFEHLNCPWCGGSGHVGDCEEADQQVKAKLERLEKEADWLAERLAKYCVDDAEKECPLIDVCPEGSCPTITTSSWREAARRAVEEA